MTSIAERRKYILDNIFKNGFVRVADLAEDLKVTQTTIRKDLTFLEKQGLLYRAYGSALPTSAPVLDINLNTKRLINFKQKQKIARRALDLIAENDSIILSAGSTIGVFAKQMLRNLHCSKVFFGVDGVDPDFGASCATMEEAELTHQMIEVSGTSIVLSDSSKIGVRGFGRICDTSEISILITDRGISDEQRKAIEAKGVKVIVA